MKLTNLLKIAAVSTFTMVTLLVPLTASAIPAGSVEYEGEETSGTTFPAFNIFHGVPSVGNEADFIRVKIDGEPNSALRNTVDIDCDNGDRFDVWFYLHNGAKPSLNAGGTGAGVADNVNAKVNFPTTKRSNFSITGGVTASDAQAISDNATIKCGDKLFKMKYVSNSAQAFLDLSNTMINLPAAFVNGSGAAVGTTGLNGKMWGCWEQRVWMGLKVEVTEVEDEVTPPTPPAKKPTKVVPASLPVTGPANVLGIFAATTIAAAVAHRYVYGRKNG